MHNGNAERKVLARSIDRQREQKSCRHAWKRKEAGKTSADGCEENRLSAPDSCFYPLTPSRHRLSSPLPSLVRLSLTLFSPTPLHKFHFFLYPIIFLPVLRGSCTQDLSSPVWVHLLSRTGVSLLYNLYRLTLLPGSYGSQLTQASTEVKSYQWKLWDCVKQTSKSVQWSLLVVVIIAHWI